MSQDKDLALPTLKECDSEPLLSQLLAPLKLPREVLASSKDISKVWSNLTELLQDIHPDYRQEFLARMVGCSIC